jgi:WD40 repeat protein
MSKEAVSRSSPFVGLRPFGPDDASFFFGRTREAATLAGALLGNALTVLFGPPGGGKTSLVRVSVAAQLAAATEGQARIVYWNRWQAGFLPELKADVGQALNRSGTLHEMVAAHVASGDAPVFLLFDQFEEYFRYAEDPVRTEFAESLALIANDRTLDAHVLMALREDGLSLLDRLRVRLPNILGNTVELRLLDKVAARDAILLPLAKWREIGWPGPTAEPAAALVTALLEQTDQALLRAGGVGAAAADVDMRGRIETAFLQLALQRLWETELGVNSTTMRLETLNGPELGGVRGIVKAHLHQALGQFDSSHRLWLGLMFRYLVTPSGGKQANSAVDLFTSLTDEGRGPPAAKELGEILERLASGDRRILRTQPNVRAPNDGPLFELFHDALAQPVLEWSQTERAADLRRQADTARQQARRAQWTVGVLSLLLVVVVAAGIIAFGAMKEATTRGLAALYAQSRFLAKEGRTSLKDGLAVRSYLVEAQSIERLEANSLAIHSDIAQALTRSAAAADFSYVEGHGKSIKMFALSSDGTRAIVAYEDDPTARVWDLSGQTPVAALLEGHTQAINSIALSPDGGRAVTGSEDKTARVWDIAGPAPKLIAVLQGLDYGVVSAAFSQDGKRILTRSGLKTFRIWDLTEATPVATVPNWQKEFGTDSSLSLASMSSDWNRAISVSEDRTLRLWDLTGPEPVATSLGALTGRVTGWAVASDGTRAIIASDDKITRVWDLTRPTPLATVLEGHTDTVLRVEMSEDGKRAITGSADKTARVWDLNDAIPKLVAVLGGHTDAVYLTWLSGDGRRAVTSSGDSTVLVWDLIERNPVGMMLEGFARGFKFSNDGSRAMMVGPDGYSARVWEIAALRDSAHIRDFAEAKIRLRWEARGSGTWRADDPDRPGCLSEAELVDLFVIPPPQDHPASQRRTAPAASGPVCPAMGVEPSETGLLGYGNHVLHLLDLGLAWHSAVNDVSPPGGQVTVQAKGH